MSAAAAAKRWRHLLHLVETKCSLQPHSVKTITSVPGEQVSAWRVAMQHSGIAMEDCVQGMTVLTVAVPFCVQNDTVQTGKGHVGVVYVRL